jgi:hypothetical protein
VLRIPYGIYDLGRNAGFVNVGTDHDTGAFAVASIRGWWRREGRALYPHARTIVITADVGGSNGSRLRLDCPNDHRQGIERHLSLRPPQISDRSEGVRRGNEEGERVIAPGPELIACITKGKVFTLATLDR